MATIAVRYFSKGGKTEKIAKAIARGAGVEALSVTEEPELKENTDLLFLGGAPYANIMAPELKAYAARLTAEKAGTVVLFSTSNWSRRTLKALRKLLSAKGIRVLNEEFYAQAAGVDNKTESACDFGKKTVERLN